MMAVRIRHRIGGDRACEEPGSQQKNHAEKNLWVYCPCKRNRGRIQVAAIGAREVKNQVLDFQPGSGIQGIAPRR